VDIILQTDGEKVKPGQKGNLILRAVAPTSPDPKKKGVQNQKRQGQVTLPAIPFEVVKQ
jgi:hypothetical protein